MKAKGQITIEEGLTLNNPTMRIKCVQYEQFNNEVSVEIYFTEVDNGYNHSRVFNFSNEEGKDLGYSDILEMIKGHEVLKQFS